MYAYIVYVFTSLKEEQMYVFLHSFGRRDPDCSEREIAEQGQAGPSVTQVLLTVLAVLAEGQ